MLPCRLHTSPSRRSSTMRQCVTTSCLGCPLSKSGMTKLLQRRLCDLTWTTWKVLTTCTVHASCTVLHTQFGLQVGHCIAPLEQLSPAQRLLHSAAPAMWLAGCPLHNALCTVPSALSSKLSCNLRNPLPMSLIALARPFSIDAALSCSMHSVACTTSTYIHLRNVSHCIHAMCN